jgi:hypothetical protein
MQAKKAFDQLVLAGTGGSENKEIETVCLNTGTKFQRPQYPVLTIRTLEVLQVFGGLEIQLVFRATVIDLVFGQWRG